MDNKIKVLVDKLPTHPRECRFSFQNNIIGEVPKYEMWYCKLSNNCQCAFFSNKRNCDCLMSISELGGVNNASER